MDDRDIIEFDPEDEEEEEEDTKKDPNVLEVKVYEDIDLRDRFGG